MLRFADPAAGVTLIAPPEANSRGTAELEYPIEVPPGHRDLAPQLTVRYSSERQNSWLGLGWSLPIGAIEVDTRFGVPRYNGDERYLLDGAQLTPVDKGPQSGCSDPEATSKRYRRRVEGSFERILRCGEGTRGFTWEVTDQQGTRSTYGGAGARLADPDDPGRVARWALKEVQDTFGNRVQYEYDEASYALPAESAAPTVVARQLYPTLIRYGHGDPEAGASSAHYFVRFARERDEGSEQYTTREDLRTSARVGFLTVEHHRLASVTVGFKPDNGPEETIRRYEFAYETGAFGRSVLGSIAKLGHDRTSELHRHVFSYDMPEGGFGAAKVWSTVDANGSSSGPGRPHSRRTALSGNNHGDGGMSAFVGVGSPDCLNHGGAGVNFSVGGSSVSSVFEDVNGDGLPDLVSKNSIRLQQLDDSKETSTFGPSTDPGWNRRPYSATSGSLGIELAGHFMGDAASVGTNATFTWSDQKSALHDMDGDGRLDQVTPRSVSFATDEDGILKRLKPKQRRELEGTFVRTSPLVHFRARTAGLVRVAGELALVDPADDGGHVEAEVLHVRAEDGEQALLWHDEIGSTAACVPTGRRGCGADGLLVELAEGDALIFMVNGGPDESDHLTRWNPVIEYMSCGARDGSCEPLDPGREQRDEYGLPLYHYDWARDFRIVDARSSSWSPPLTGTVSFEASADDLPADRAIEVQLKRGSGDWVDRTDEVSADEGVVWSDIYVTPGERWQLRSPFSGSEAHAPLDPAAAGLIGHVAYTEVCGQPYFEEPDTCGAVDCDDDGEFCDVGGQQVRHAQLNAWLGAADTAYDDAVDGYHWTDQPTGLAGGFRGWSHGEWNAHVMFDAARLHEQVSEGSSLVVTPGLPLLDSAPARTTFGFSPDDSAVLASGLNTLFEDEEPLEAYPGPGGGNTAVSRQQGPLYIGRGEDFLIAAGRLKPSRVGGKPLEDLLEGSPGLEHTRTDSFSVAAGVGATVQFAGSTTFTRSLLLDLNGDQRPDKVTKRGVEFQTCDGTYCDGSESGEYLGREDVDFGILRSTKSLSTRLGFGLALPKKSVDAKGKSKPGANVLPSLGVTLARDVTKRDFIDINGDGLPDHVRYDNSRRLWVSLNLGYRFAPEVKWTVPRWGADAPEEVAVEMTDEDVSSIAKEDESISTLPRQAAEAPRLTLQNTKSMEYNFKGFGGGPAYTDTRTIVDLVDINGDGLPDHVRKDPGAQDVLVKLNQGGSFSQAMTWQDPEWPVQPGKRSISKGNDTLAFSEDITGNLGLGVGPIFVPLVLLCISVELAGTAAFGSGGEKLALKDVNGDGYIDRVLRKGDTIYAKLNQGARANLLTEVSQPLGGRLELSYEPEGNYIDHDATPRVDMPDTLWTLSAVVAHDGQNNRYEKTFNYHRSGYFDRQEREDYGFAHVTTTREDDSRVDLYLDNQSFYTRGLPTRRVVSDALGNVFTVESYEYKQPLDDQPALSGWAFPALSAQVTEQYEHPAEAEDDAFEGPRWTRVEYSNFDERGHARRVHDLADQGDADDVTTTYAYAFDERLHLSTLIRETTTDAADNILRETESSYTEAGALELQSRFVVGGSNPETGEAYGESSPGELNTQFVYDERGNLSRQKDPSGYERCHRYDTVLGLYRVQTVDNLAGHEQARCDSDDAQNRGYVTLAAPNYYYGVPATTVDANGNSRQVEFDVHGRVRRIWGPLSSTDAAVCFEYSQGWCEAGTDGCGIQPCEPGAVENGAHARGTTAAWASAFYRDVTASDGDPIQTVAFVDGLGRTIQTKREMERDLGESLLGEPVTERGFAVSGAVGFDERGRQDEQGQPHFSVAPPTQLVDAAMKHAVTTQHDILGRVVHRAAPSEASPDGTPAVATFKYDLHKVDGLVLGRTRQTDAEGRVRVEYKTIDGLTVAVDQPRTPGSSSPTLRTHYEYNALGELQRVEDAGGNVTTAVHDSVGRLVALDNPDTGLTTHSYFSNGNLGAVQTAALRADGLQLTYEYTPHSSRLEHVVDPLGQGVTYTYGSPAERGLLHGNVAGRVKEEVTEGLVRRFRYDAEGRSTRRESEFTPQPHRKRSYSYALTYEYDGLGRVLSMGYPNEQVTYEYDRGARVRRVEGVEHGAGATPGLATVYLQHQGYDQFGEVTRRIAGNGIETRYAYQPMTRRLSEVNASHRDPLLADTQGERAFQRLRYSYDRVGNMLTLRNESPWDPQMRGDVQVGTSSQTFTYDDLNQLTSAQGVHQVRDHWLYRYQQAFVYDEVSNLVEKGQAMWGEVAGSGGGFFGRADRGLYGQCESLNDAFGALTPVPGFQVSTTDTEGTFCLSYDYTSERPHAPTRVDELRAYADGPRSLEIEYDDNGNQVVWHRPDQWRTLRMDVDGNNRITSFRERGYLHNSVFYDAQGQRVLHLQHNADQETAYLGRYLTIKNNDEVMKHIFAGEMRIATKLEPDWMGRGPTTYHHPDHLGSAHFVSGGDQTLVHNVEFLPGGEPFRQDSDAGYGYQARNWYTGQEFDAEVGLNYHGARYYNPHLSQFTQPDPILARYMRGAPNGGVFQPQNLGLYSYVSNNPVNYVDPEGLATRTPSVRPRRASVAALEGAQVDGKDPAFKQRLSKITAVQYGQVAKGLTLKQKLEQRKGVRFSDQVGLEELEVGRLYVQYVGKGVGNYFALVDSDVTTLGINPNGRTRKLFRVVEPTLAVISTASEIVDDWTDPEHPYYSRGGGTQLHVPNKAALRLVE